VPFVIHDYLCSRTEQIILIMSNFRNALNRRPILVVIIWFNVAASAACTVQSEYKASKSAVSDVVADTILNSERIRQKFGSYGVEVLYSDSTTRITRLYSTEGDVDVTRTFAVVMYPSVVDSALFLEHNEILNGGSIGQIFKESGWTIKKKSIYLGQISQSDKYDNTYEMMGGIVPTDLALYMYMFTVYKEGRSYNYATIAELYHPAYLTTGDMRRIYTAVDDSLTSALDVTQKLDMVRHFMSIDLLFVEPSGQ